jgi:hypothetical protein
MHRSSSFPSAASAALVLACAAVLPAAPLSAQIAPGSTLVFTGVADVTDVGLPGVMLAFDKRVTADPSANTGTFASLNRRNGAIGSIDDFRVGNGPQSLDTFLRVGAYTFDLRAVPSGPYGADDCYVWPELGQRCTPYQSVIGDPTDNVGLSPFYVENVASGDPNAPLTALAAFNVLGTVSGPGRTTSDFFGTIGATFVGQSYQEVLITLERAGLQGVTFTGTFVVGSPVRAATVGSTVGSTAVPAFARASSLASPVTVAADTVVPEPSTVALLITGLGALGVTLRRRRA